MSLRPNGGVVGLLDLAIFLALSIMDLKVPVAFAILLSSLFRISTPGSQSFDRKTSQI